MNVIYISNEDLLFKSFCRIINPTVANKVYGKSFHIRIWSGRKYLANWDVQRFDTPNSNG